VRGDIDAPVRRCQRCGLLQPPADFCRRCGAANPLPVAPESYGRTSKGCLKPLLFSLITLVVACMLGCVLLVLLGSTGLHARSIAIAFTAAILPTIAWGSVILWLDRTEPETWELRGLTFLWGSVIAIFIALVLNTTALSIFSLSAGADASEVLTAVIAAPLIEESAKGTLVLLVLWFTRRHIDGLLDGWILGALVGLGFAMTENITYLGAGYVSGGAKALGALFVIRCLINGMGHAVWTSFTGAAIGWSRNRHGRGVLRLIVPTGGWAMAVAGHATWNLGGSLLISFIAIGLERMYLFPEWKALIVGGVLGGLPFTIPPILVAYIFARLGGEQEERVIRQYLPIEVHLGTLSSGEAEVIADPERRRQSVRSARERRGPKAARWQKQFDRAAIRLAFFHYHANRGERPFAADVHRAEQLRWQLASLRWAMRPTAVKST
jgi:protease PrsW